MHTNEQNIPCTQRTHADQNVVASAVGPRPRPHVRWTLSGISVFWLVLRPFDRFRFNTFFTMWAHQLDAINNFDTSGFAFKLPSAVACGNGVASHGEAMDVEVNAGRARCHDSWNQLKHCVSEETHLNRCLWLLRVAACDPCPSYRSPYVRFTIDKTTFI